MGPRLFVVLAALLTLEACDRPKDRAAVIQAQAPGPAPPARAAATAGVLTRDLPRRDEFPGFYLDVIGSAADPLTKPAVVKSGANLEMAGFAFDPVTRLPAKGVDLEVDGELFATIYGHVRQDVADNQKAPALAAVGYRTAIPKTLEPGQHTVIVRVASSDGKAYFESPAIEFKVQ